MPNKVLAQRRFVFSSQQRFLELGRSPILQLLRYRLGRVHHDRLRCFLPLGKGRSLSQQELEGRGGRRYSDDTRRYWVERTTIGLTKHREILKRHFGARALIDRIFHLCDTIPRS